MADTGNRMINLPLFGAPNQIESHFKAEANLILYHGDVREFIVTIPDNSVSLIITSPPYNLGKDYENRVSIQKYLNTQAEIIAQLYRILREDGSLCWQVGNFVENGEVYPLDILYYSIFKELGLFLRNRISRLLALASNLISMAHFAPGLLANPCIRQQGTKK